MAHQRTVTIVLAASVALGAAGCGSTSSSPTTSVAPVTTATESTAAPTTGAPGVSEAGITPERCRANRDAGTITYLSGFDYAAAASIVEVVVAQKMGYFEKMCLTVELKPSFSTANYPLVAGNEAQFSSAGSFTELAEFNTANSADLVGLSVDGRTAIDVLIAKPDKVTTYEDLRGKTIGVKGKLPPSVKALLAKDGLVEGKDYQTVLIDGFDPKVHIELPSIVAFPGWKSNEPGQLDAAGIEYVTFDPTSEQIPGSFGLIYTNAKFLSEHPTAAQDFMRAAMKGLADSLNDPDAAATACFEAITANGNQNYLSLEGEKFRWQIGARLVRELTPNGTPYGMPDPAGLKAEVDAYAAVGVFAEGPTPSTDGLIDAGVLAGIYDGAGTVIWPRA